MRPVSIAVYPLVCLVAASICGCATERLGATPPTGVNLTGEWRFNPNLSDDPDKLTDLLEHGDVGRKVSVVFTHDGKEKKSTIALKELL